MYSIQHYVIKFVSYLLATGWCFSPGTLVSSTNKTDCYAWYTCRLNIVESDVKHHKTKTKLFFFTESDVVVCIWVVSEDNSRSKFSVKVSHDSVPITVIAETIRRRSRMMGISKEHAERCIEEYSDTYALKVCGCDLFLLEEHPLSQYKVGNCC